MFVHNADVAVVLVPGTAEFAAAWVDPAPRTKLLQHYVPPPVFEEPVVLFRLMPQGVEAIVAPSMPQKAMPPAAPPSTPPALRLVVRSVVGRLLVSTTGCVRRKRVTPKKLTLRVNWVASEGRKPCADAGDGAAGAGAGAGAGEATTTRRDAGGATAVFRLVQAPRGDRPAGLGGEYTLWKPAPSASPSPSGKDPAAGRCDHHQQCLPLPGGSLMRQRLRFRLMAGDVCVTDHTRAFGSKSLQSRVLHVPLEVVSTVATGARPAELHTVVQSNALVAHRQSGVPAHYAPPSSSGSHALVAHVEVGVGALVRPSDV